MRLRDLSGVDENEGTGPHDEKSRHADGDGNMSVLPVERGTSSQSVTHQCPWPPVPEGIKWIVIESRFLDGEQVLLVMQKKYLKEARKEHPGKVIYFPPEIEELKRHKDMPEYEDYLKKVHMVKKKFDAWIVPSNSPVHRTRAGIQEVPTTPIHIRRSNEMRHVGQSRTTGKEKEPAKVRQMALSLAGDERSRTR